MAEVLFHRVDQGPAAPDIPVLGVSDGTTPDSTTEDLAGALRNLTARLDLARGRDAPAWGIKVEVGPPGRRPTIDPRWVDAVAGALDAPGGVFCFDTLSITTRGLEEADAHRAAARNKGYGSGPGRPPFRVADDPADGPESASRLPDGGLEVRPAGALGGADGLVVLSALRPHPHLGFRGAVEALGLGGVDRASKIDLHRDIRPAVDTPLCAGCGSCLDVCLFDAIVINAGRATIDHRLCTGCGACMTVCFMAGIAPEEEAGIARFQERVAESAGVVAGAFAGPARGRLGFFNVLVGLGGQESGPRARRGRLPGTIGVVASTDPVACDQAAWDLVVARIGAPLKEWSGYRQEPGPLLDRAEALGLGSRRYRFVEV